MLQFESLLLLKTRDQHGTRRLRRSQDSPKTVPRRPQDGPRRLKTAPRRPRDGPGQRQNDPGRLQDGPKRPQDTPKTTPRQLQDVLGRQFEYFFDDLLIWTLRHANLKYCLKDLINLRINLVHVCSHSLGHPIYLIFR